MRNIGALMVLLLSVSACSSEPKAPPAPPAAAAPTVQDDAANRAQALSVAASARQNGENDRAIGIYDNLLRADPAMIDAKEGKALALVAKGDYDTPVQLLDEVVKADPKRGQSLNAIGVLFTTRGLHKEAEKYFTEASRNWPSPYVPLKNLALSQALQGKYDTGICTLKQTSDATMPGSADRKRTQMDLALIYASAGQLQDALAIASSYYVGSTSNDNFKLYSKLSEDKKLAQGYMSTAIVAGNSRYYDSWKN